MEWLEITSDKIQDGGQRPNCYHIFGILGFGRMGGSYAIGKTATSAPHVIGENILLLRHVFSVQ